MSRTYQSDDWNTYKMDYHNPHRELEPMEKEIATVGAALKVLQEEGILPHTHYDPAKLIAHRRAVRDLFEIPWTAITPRMERFLYAVNAIAQPPYMIAAGIFCGFTFISNAGAAVGPGACYAARDLAGVEINTTEAARAERNVRLIDPTGVAHILAADAVEVVAKYSHQMFLPIGRQGRQALMPASLFANIPGILANKSAKTHINLLYLDANGDRGRGKGIYLEILQAGYDRMPSGGIVLAHNSVNSAEKLKPYSAFVRDPSHFRSSVNVIFDKEGLEVSVK